MKFKTLAVMAISGMFAASFAYAATSAILTADDGAGMNPGTMSGSMSGNAGMQNNDMSNAQNPNAAPNIGASTPDNNGNANPNGSDDISADTATGDDDY